MTCPAVTTGQGFLVETLSHLDCQAQVIGSYGFQSLASPGSPASLVLTALLTLFVALFGFRLLFGGQVGMRDAVGAVLKIGIVLTLAVSWPAYRTLAYDTVLHGPAEVAAAIGGQTLPDMRKGLAQRLQEIDDGIIAMTAVGAGRQTGAMEVPGEEKQSFTGVALQDETGYGWGRAVYLASTIGPLAALRIAAGLLLAIAPVIAGLLLFDISRGIFAGWLRGLALTALGSTGLTLLYAVQVAVMQPWLTDALYRRSQGYATPSAPTELFALSLGFALAALVLLAILARVAFQNSWILPIGFKRNVPVRQTSTSTRGSAIYRSQSEFSQVQLRAMAVGEGVRNTMRFESSRSEQVEQRRVTEAASRRDSGNGRHYASGSHERLGTSYRRISRRDSLSHRRRDSGA